MADLKTSSPTPAGSGTQPTFQPVGEKNIYDIKQYRYPEKLLDNDNEYGGNKVLFFINVAEASRYSGTKGEKADFKMWDIPEGDVKKFSGQEVLLKAEQRSREFSNYTGATKQAEKYGVQQIQPSASITATSMKRLSVAIALYMPNQIAQATSVVWSDDDFTSETASKYLEAGSKALSGNAMGTGTALVSGKLAQELKDKTILQKTMRITPGNSKAEMLFKSVDFRTFDFSYAFSPKSETEAANVMSIIRMFKHHMLPEFKDEAKFLYIYPSEFNIKYYHGNAENPFVEKQMTAVLTRVNVDYTPNGQFNTFANGMPTQINMTLSFKELALPTKETSPYNGHGV